MCQHYSNKSNSKDIMQLRLQYAELKAAYEKNIAKQKQAEEDLRLKNTELKTLNRIILKTTEVLNLQSRLENIMDDALQIVGIEGGTICLINPYCSVRWVHDKAHPYFDENGNLLRFVGATLDTTEKKHLQEELEILNAELELKVKQRTIQLEAANKELEAFSYSVSHDLRAPLRHINSYFELLNEQFSNELSDKARHYLDTVSGAVKQIGVFWAILNEQPQVNKL